MLRFSSLLLLAACTAVDLDTDDPAWTGWDDDAVDDVPEPVQPVEIRVATWNVQGLGEVGSDDYRAVASVLRRLDADVVGLNEVESWESDDLETLASELGYSVVAMASGQPFGGTGNAVLSRFEELSTRFPGSDTLSGDDTANDVTRFPVVHTGRIAELDAEITVVSQHWKSGFETDDIFRRAIDGWRTAQAAELGASSEFVVVMGDVNDQPDDVRDPERFFSLPGSLPFSYRLGDDLFTLLSQQGVPNDPFGVLTDLGLDRLPAAQRDGSEATRPVSGRRIDHVFASRSVRDGNARTEIYDARQDQLETGLADGAGPPDADATAFASDHLPVLLVFEVTPTTR